MLDALEEGLIPETRYLSYIEMLVDAAPDDFGEEEEIIDEPGLRPRTLAEFVGQPELKGHLGVMLGAAAKRREAADHLLFAGPPGLGKTTLANIIAAEMNTHLQITSAGQRQTSR